MNTDEQIEMQETKRKVSMHLAPSLIEQIKVIAYAKYGGNLAATYRYIIRRGLRAISMDGAKVDAG